MKAKNQSIQFKIGERYDFYNAPEISLNVIKPGEMPHPQTYLDINDKFELRFMWDSGRAFSVLMDKIEANNLSEILAGNDHYGDFNITDYFAPKKSITGQVEILLESKMNFENMESDKIAVLEAEIRELNNEIRELKAELRRSML